jgi:hypothetical protein
MSKQIIPHFDWTTLGADPEVVIFSNEGNFVRANEALEGKTNHMVEIDGMFAELHPNYTTCREILTQNIRDCIASLFHKIPDMIAANDAVAKIPKKELEVATQGEVILGCEPDISAYGGTINIIDIGDPRKLETRTGGGHMHFGGNAGGDYTNMAAIRDDGYLFYKTYKPIANDIVKTMDYLCGLPCVLIDKGSGPAERRKLYGKAGSYRIQKHGIEYRVLSNFWLRHFSLVSLVFLFGRIALIIATEYPDLMEKIFSLIPEGDVQAIINENNEEGAKEATKYIIPYINLLTNYPAIPYLMFLNNHDFDELFPKDLASAWGVGRYRRTDGGVEQIEGTDWWGGQASNGFHSFIKHNKMPVEWKDEIKSLVREYK